MFDVSLALFCRSMNCNWREASRAETPKDTVDLQKATPEVQQQPHETPGWSFLGISYGFRSMPIEGLF